MSDDMILGKFYIEWQNEKYHKYETDVLQSLNEIKGYIIQAIFWLKNKPGKVPHHVHISLDFDETLGIDDFYLELYFELDGKVMMNIISVDSESGVGFVRFPPLETFSMDDWNELSEKMLEYYKTVDVNQLATETVRIVQKVPYKAHQRLKLLSEFYGKEDEEIINELIEAIGFESGWIINMSNNYQVPVSLTNVISHLLYAGRHSTDTIFNKLLDRFEGKGLFVQDDMDFNLDEMSFWISFVALSGCDLYVHSFDVTLGGPARLEATFHGEMGKKDDLGLRKLKEIVNNVGENIKLSESFQGLMELDVILDEDDEEFFSLMVDITEDSLHYLPTIPDLSDLFKQILDKSGLKSY